MAVRTRLGILVVLLVCGRGFALEPNEVLVVVNREMATSTRIGRYYCENRGVPYKNIIYLRLGKRIRDNISRSDYDRLIAEPIRFELLKRATPGEIRCLVTTYGVPIRVGMRGPLKGRERRLKELEDLVERERKRIEELEAAEDKGRGSAELKKRKGTAAKMQLEIDGINGKETHASVDSELSMVQFGAYELYRWQGNRLRGDVLGLDFQTLMVSRLDGSDYEIVEGLVDKAIEAEKTVLKGVAYIDSRGIKNEKSNLFGYFDQSLRDMATLTKLRTSLSVKEDRAPELFAPGSCPETAIYCGWYSLKRYVDAFDFVPGAVGYHIASFEGAGLHDPNSSNWCPAMLRDGITATLGPVSEPYLHAFPQPRMFFGRLYRGDCLVEAYYRTKPFNSWQLMLIGDPLYRPFGKRQGSSDTGS